MPYEARDICLTNFKLPVYWSFILTYTIFPQLNHLSAIPNQQAALPRVENSSVFDDI